jgi:hypothetical protein
MMTALMERSGVVLLNLRMFAFVLLATTMLLSLSPSNGKFQPHRNPIIFL